MKANGHLPVLRSGRVKPATSRLSDYQRRNALARRRKTPLDFHGLLNSIDGGIPTAMDILRYSMVESAVQVVAAYDQLNDDQKYTLDLNAFVKELGIDSGTIVGEFSRIAYERGQDISRLKQGLGLITMMDASVKTGSRVGAAGFRERQMHFQQAGLAPQRQAASVKQGVQVNIGRGARLRPTSTEVTGLPPIIQDQRALADRIRAAQDAMIDAPQPRMNEEDDDGPDAPTDGSDE